MSLFRRRSGRPEPGAGAPEVYSVTGAATPHSEDQDQRITRYLISMAIRTACVVLALVVPWPWKWVFIVGAVVLPYVAVVMANSGRRRAPGTLQRVDTPATRQLPSARRPLPPETDFPRPGPD